MAVHLSMSQQDMIKEVIQTLVSVVEHKSEFFRGHSERVATQCILFSSFLTLHRDFINDLYLAGLLYDIGMVYIPMEIINKPDKLSPEEMAAVREHPVIAETILSRLSYLKKALPIIRHHHENYNGDGYPDGLRGDAIPIGSRILSLVDAYDAMTSERPHRAALPQDEALALIREGSGKTFDPHLVDEFIRFITRAKDASRGKIDPPSSPVADGRSPSEQKADAAEVDAVQKAVSDIVLAFKRGIIDTPAFPAVIHKIQNVLRSPDKSLADAARVIEQDQIVTLRLLSMSNSLHYGGGGNVKTVDLALSRIGMKEARNVISALAMKSMYAADNVEIKELMEKFWIHAIATAYATRILAARLREPDEDSLFLAGLTHDVGKVLLLNGLAARLFKNGQTNNVDMEKVLASIQAVHASFGGALLKKWNFSSELISAVINHERPDLSPVASRTSLILYLANMLTRRIGFSPYQEEPEIIKDVMIFLDIDEPAVDAILEEVSSAVEKTITSE